MRLMSWPVGLKWVSMTPTGGPAVKGATDSATAYVQTVESPFGLVGFQFAFPALRGGFARQFRGLVAALHGGANAVRVPIYDPDLPLRDLGITTTQAQRIAGTAWSNDEAFSNGELWGIGPPTCPVTTAAAVGAVTLSFNVSDWSDAVPLGFMIGIVGHFACYTVTEASVASSIATVRIWPPLRKAVAVDDLVTVRPVLAMRLASPSAGQYTRGPTVMESASLSLIEVPDDVIREYLVT